MLHYLLIIFFAWWALNIVRSAIRRRARDRREHTNAVTGRPRIVPRGYVHEPVPEPPAASEIRSTIISAEWRAAISEQLRVVGSRGSYKP